MLDLGGMGGILEGEGEGEEQQPVEQEGVGLGVLEGMVMLLL
jgi:hypothetical protein